jgi:hypothetical protein
MRVTALLALAAPLALLAAAPAPAQMSVGLGKFKSVELRGGGKVVLRHGPVQNVRILSGDLNTSSIKVVGAGSRRNLLRNNYGLVIDTCASACPAGYDLQVEVTTPSLVGVAVSGDGRIESSGQFAPVKSLAAAVQGSGTVDVRAIPAARVAASVQGTGSVLTRAEQSLAASAAGGGQIRYWGDPAVTPAIQSGGTVERGAS